jgi:hypothetical protein
VASGSNMYFNTGNAAIGTSTVSANDVLYVTGATSNSTLTGISTASAVGVWGRNTASTGTTTTAIGVRGSSQLTTAAALTNAARGVSGEFTGGSGYGYGVYGSSASTSGSTAGVFGTVTGGSGSYAAVWGQVPSTGSSAAAGVKGENLNTSGGVGVTAYTAAATGRSIFALGSVYIENLGSAGSATSGADIILARSNSGGYCGFNAAGQAFNASDRNVKENFEPVDNAEILDKVLALPITRWNFKKQDPSVKYVGPMAQDFHAAFGLGGTDDRVIHATNAQGVTIAALQGLNARLEDRCQALQAEVTEMKSRMASMERMLEQQARLQQELIEQTRSAGHKPR